MYCRQTHSSESKGFCIEQGRHKPLPVIRQCADQWKRHLTLQFTYEQEAYERVGWPTRRNFIWYGNASGEMEPREGAHCEIADASSDREVSWHSTKASERQNKDRRWNGSDGNLGLIFSCQDNYPFFGNVQPHQAPSLGLWFPQWPQAVSTELDAVYRAQSNTAFRPKRRALYLNKCFMNSLK